CRLHSPDLMPPPPRNPNPSPSTSASLALPAPPPPLHLPRRHLLPRHHPEGDDEAGEEEKRAAEAGKDDLAPPWHCNSSKAPMAEDPLWPCHSSPPLRPRCCSQRKWSRLTAPRAKISTGSSPCSYLPEAPLVFSRARLVYRFYQDASDLTRRASAVGMEFITTMEVIVQR
ncbi:unnamed protein product, partial [Urochloa humidicola]